jgi:hypothetical protein
MRGPTKKRGVTDHSLVFKSGRSGSKLGPIPMTRPICWKKTIGNSRRAIAGPINVRCEGRCDGRLISGNGFGSLRRSYKSSTTDPRGGRHPRLRPATQARLLVRSPGTGRVRRMGQKLPHTLTSENNCLPAARCIQATPFGKIDEPAVCAIVRSCLDPKNPPVACLAVQHAQGAFGGDGS